MAGTPIGGDGGPSRRAEAPLLRLYRLFGDSDGDGDEEVLPAEWEIYDDEAGALDDRTMTTP